MKQSLATGHPPYNHSQQPHTSYVYRAELYYTHQKKKLMFYIAGLHFIVLTVLCFLYFCT